MQAEIGTILQNIYKHEQSQLQLFLTHKAISKYIKKLKKIYADLVPNSPQNIECIIN